MTIRVTGSLRNQRRRANCFLSFPHVFTPATPKGASLSTIHGRWSCGVAGRTRADEITVFNNNTGAGTQFAALGSVVLKKARDMGLGREIPTDWFLEDVTP